MPFTPRPDSDRPVCSFIPPYVLEALATSGDPRVEERARDTLAHDEALRRARRGEAGARPAPSPRKRAQRGTDHAPSRSVHDAKHGTDLPGTEVRGEGDPATPDTAVNEAYDGLGATWELFHATYDRNSLDDKGLGLVASVHYSERYDNAFWDGSQMVFGDGDGKIFLGFTRSVDVIGHELAHGVTQYTSGLNYQDQSGALNESVSDVFGVLVKQRLLGQSAEQADWLVGADLLAPGVKGVALRSMKAPGTAYDDPRLGKDPQPAHMRDYVDTTDDNGGVHINSGIPNRAFYVVATALGGNAWEGAGRIWYDTVTGDIRANCDFATFAQLTVDAAARRFGEGSTQVTAVRDAWSGVGVTPGVAPTAPAGDGEVPAGTGPTVHVRRTGGVAGIVKERTVAIDTLPSHDTTQWHRLLAGRTLHEMEAADGPGRPDAFCYGVRCAHPHVDVTIAEPHLTHDVRSLLERTLEDG